jgi:ADP-ribose pyrophosphatase
MEDEHLLETTVARRIVHEGRFMTFRVDTVVDVAGVEHRREIVAHPGAVCVIPLVGEEVLMVRQYRSAVGSVVLELPAGTLDHDDAGGVEDPAEAAPRELGEETGHRAGRWRPLGRFWTAPGFTDERMHLYLATELEPIADYDGPDEDEYLDLVRLPWREAVAMAEDGRIVDAKSIVGLLRLARLAEAGEL